MFAIVALHFSLQLLMVGVIGACLGAVVNYAVYRFAWFHPREITPWGPQPEKAPQRSWSDRLPIVGWWGLRREHVIHGRGFWIRPLLIESLMAAGLMTLYWWEVYEQSLHIPQIKDWLSLPLLPLGKPIPISWTLAIFANHALLITLMAAASLIDIDEKTIPDLITIPGTLLGLVFAAALPMALLPHLAVRTTPQAISAQVDLPPLGAAQFKPGNSMHVEPTTLAAPNAWPNAALRWHGLAIGQACWWLWCFALTPRIWRGRRGICRGLAILLRRVVRELTRLPLGIIAWPGSMALVAVWWWSTSAWIGLLTALVGLAVSGGLVWAIRKAGTFALNREAMGFGDVTLMMMVGTFVGWQAGIIIFFVAPFAALIVGVTQLLLRRDDEIPYGPFLCLGTLFVVVRWADVWNYTQFYFQLPWLVPAVLVICVVLLGLMLLVWQQIKCRLLGGGQHE